jgi:hypothetical protein
MNCLSNCMPSGRYMKFKSYDHGNTYWLNCRYCLPTDTTRPLLAADEMFFSARITGKGESPLVCATDRT